MERGALGVTGLSVAQRVIMVLEHERERVVHRNAAGRLVMVHPVRLSSAL